MKDKVIKGFFYIVLGLLAVTAILIAMAFSIGGFAGIGYVLYAFACMLALGAVSLFWLIYAIAVQKFNRIWLPAGMLILSAIGYVLSVK